MIKWKNDRPPEWKNPNEKYHNAFDIPTVQDAEWEAYEAGADALLKLLRASGTKTDSFRTNHNPIYMSNPQQKGVYVFIPK